MSQAALAKKLGVKQPTISNWESGKTTPSDTQMDILVDILQAKEDVAADDTLRDGPAYGEWLSVARTEKRLSRAELAAKSGVSAPQIHNIETGRTANPRPATRTKLEDALGTTAPKDVLEEVKREAEIEGVGQFVGFDPHDENDFPNEPGVYVFYDVSDRPIYVGESGNIKRRIRSDHIEKFWYRTPIVEKASYVRVEDQKLRRQLEDTLIKFLKSNAVINRSQVDR